MAEMKGIKLCGECINYNWKTHKCKIGCNDDSNAQAPFYGDCPLPDVVPMNKEELIDKIATYFEKEENWHDLKHGTWLSCGKSHELRMMLRESLRD